MHSRDVVQFVGGTPDPAFAVDGYGSVVAWNRAAEDAFGVSSDLAIGRPCNEIICGKDENGVICSEDCMVLRSANRRKNVGNFDLQVKTPDGEKWFNVSAVVIDVASSLQPFTVHIMRPTDVYKRLELLLRDFITSRVDIPADQAEAILFSASSVARNAGLTKRERQILKLVEHGGTSIAIGDELDISPSTVDNHLRHILKKLNAHSRLEAVLRAERSGLI